MKRCRENEKGIMYYGVDGLAILSRISNLQSLYVSSCPLKVTERCHDPVFVLSFL